MSSCVVCTAGSARDRHSLTRDRDRRGNPSAKHACRRLLARPSTVAAASTRSRSSPWALLASFCLPVGNGRRSTRTRHARTGSATWPGRNSAIGMTAPAFHVCEGYWGQAAPCRVPGRDRCSCPLGRGLCRMRRPAREASWKPASWRARDGAADCGAGTRPHDGWKAAGGQRRLVGMRGRGARAIRHPVRSPRARNLDRHGGQRDRGRRRPGQDLRH